MNVLLCPDKFKGSLTAMEVCSAIAQGISGYDPDLKVISHPLADGGDGLLDILVENIGLQIVTAQVNDPLFRAIEAEYGITSDGLTAYIEMSKASGLVLLRDSERNCMETTTLGTGELVLDAVNRGIRHIVLGLGGSATNDGGIGLAAALGYRFLDNSGDSLPAIGKSLIAIDKIDDSNLKIDLADLKVDIASDVQHMLCGPNGATYGFGRQKGADEHALASLDAGLENLARLVKQKYHIDLLRVPGAGAAGGLGGGSIAFLNANLLSGIDMIMQATEFEQRVKQADLIVTGEGKLDDQTLGGKVIDGVLRVAQIHNKPVAVLCGACSLNDKQIDDAGIFYVDPLLKPPRTLDEAMQNGSKFLAEASYAMMQTIKL